MGDGDGQSLNSERGHPAGRRRGYRHSLVTHHYLLPYPLRGTIALANIVCTISPR